MASLILENATIVNEGLSFKGGIFVKNGVIADIFSEHGTCTRMLPLLVLVYLIDCISILFSPFTGKRCNLSFVAKKHIII